MLSIVSNIGKPEISKKVHLKFMVHKDEPFKCQP